MNILVCLKIVSQATFSDSINDNDDRLSGGKLGINPADAYALELALKTKDKAPETMVTVVTMALPMQRASSATLLQPALTELSLCVTARPPALTLW